MYLPNAFPDKLLLDARDDSIQLEQIAANDLKQNLGDYLEPNYRARRMAEAYDHYVKNNGRNSEDDYLNMRVAYSETKGRSNKVFSDVIASHARRAQFDLSRTMFRGYVTKTGLTKDDTAITMVNGEDGEDENADAWAKVIHGASRHLERYGWWKCRELVPMPMVQSLKTKIMQQLVIDHGEKVEACHDGKDGAPMQLKVGSGHAATYEEMYEISADPLLLSIVQNYMGIAPIFNTPVSFLNSFVKAKNAKALSDTAQLYHHDMHRLGFVKVFVYLTDVELTSGPHTLVQGTHRNRPDHLWADGRHTDETIAKAGLAGDEVRITGKAGTVFLVDTSCLHKGAHPDTESRLMAQVQYVNSLFGKPIAASDHRIEMARKGKVAEEAADLVRKYAVKAGVRFMQNYI
jgi:Phytanoyl-CoA dioxygenase (PhyH)